MVPNKYAREEGATTCRVHYIIPPVCQTFHAGTRDGGCGDKFILFTRGTNLSFFFFTIRVEIMSLQIKTVLRPAGSITYAGIEIIERAYTPWVR